MDYIDWIKVVWQHIRLLTGDSTLYNRSTGLSPRQLLAIMPAVPPEWSKEQRQERETALLQALETLSERGFLTPTRAAVPAFLPSDMGSEQYWDTDTRFAPFPETRLKEPAEWRFMAEFNKQAQVVGPDDAYVMLRQVSAREVSNAIGRPWPEGRADKGRREAQQFLNTLRLANMIKDLSVTTGDMYAWPTYRGLFYTKHLVHK